ncbi:MAG: hypothetical protein FWF04_02910, partial [Clostridiales bacterium]|nr:hypothetical protein [Clostridiales bacterium]
GERFDYEMSVLVELLRTGVKICRITIETKYFNKNEGSHYSTFRDSRQVARALLAGKRRR